MTEGRNAASWDIAVACMTMSIKFHRDTLPPLFPTCADEFMALAPHTLSYDDLESAQRDLFDALDYSVGSITPETLMQELWLALPSLRQLLGFAGGWDVAHSDAWDVLFEALLQPDVLRFPISLLTTSALFDGIMKSLVTRLQNDVHSRDGRSRRSNPVPENASKKTTKKAYDVLLDMQELLGYQCVSSTPQLRR
ncbi:hypothetical protein OBBRIDRAFT_726130 [Obba rivulosa]|uniref:Uncharacterized protein n=1 Tax=Obba rivulosa TaxID=1052685 RepID=A0A8E2AXG9_9APHY|nr:hypothetical protein OBBRIDRAFT_726130 [Obba rivulosa]